MSRDRDPELLFYGRAEALHVQRLADAATGADINTGLCIHEISS
jgi:hypothetical protein